MYNQGKNRNEAPQKGKEKKVLVKKQVPIQTTNQTISSNLTPVYASSLAQEPLIRTAMVTHSTFFSSTTSNRATDFSAPIYRIQPQAAHTSMQEWVSVILSRMEFLWQHHVHSQFPSQIQAYLENYPNRLVYYNLLQMRLEEIFIAFKAIASGNVKSDNMSAVGTTGSFIKLLGCAIDFVPMFGSMAECAFDHFGSAVENVGMKRAQNPMKHAAKWGLMPQLYKEFELAARELVFIYQSQLDALVSTPQEFKLLKLGPKKSRAKRLRKITRNAFQKTKKAITNAEPKTPIEKIVDYAIIKMLAVIINSKEPLWERLSGQSEPLHKRLINAVCHRPAKSLIERFPLISKLPSLDVLGLNILETKEGHEWSAEALYYSPGIYIANTACCYGGNRTKPLLYGYRQGSAEDVKRLALSVQNSRGRLPLPEVTASSEMEARLLSLRQISPQQLLSSSKPLALTPPPPPKKRNTILSRFRKAPPVREKYEMKMYGSKQRILDDLMVIEFVIDKLKQKPHLNVLDLSKNVITEKGAEPLFTQLLECPELRRLHLWNNNIGFSGTLALSELLREHQRLEILDINQNQLDERCAKILAKGLAKNKNLKRLDIGFNHIKNEGVKALCEALKEHPTFNDLRIGGNQISEAGGQVLFELASSNPRMLVIKLGREFDPKVDNQISEQLRKSIQSTLQKNQDRMLMTSLLDEPEESATLSVRF